MSTQSLLKVANYSCRYYLHVWSVCEKIQLFLKSFLFPVFPHGLFVVVLRFLVLFLPLCHAHLPFLGGMFILACSQSAISIQTCLSALRIDHQSLSSALFMWACYCLTLQTYFSFFGNASCSSVLPFIPLCPCCLWLCLTLGFPFPHIKFKSQPFK